jgi:hypothetical protein
MDKTEYQEKLDELQGYLHIKDYASALDLVDSIDWKKVKSVRTLNMVADVYEVNKDYVKCRYVLNIALGRSSIGKSILYRLTEVCIKQRDIKAAQDYFRQYSKLAPRDNGKLLLEYKLAKAMKKPIEEQIRILEEYKEREYTERWSYELALLYSKAGDTVKCVDACDDMILWFSEGKYVLKAMELKQKYAPLTSSQQAYFDKEQKGSDESVLYQTAQLEGISEFEKQHKEGTVLDWMDKAGAEVTKDVNVDESAVGPAPDGGMDSISVTSPQFVGSHPDLKKELEKSIETIKTNMQEEPEDAAEAKAAEEPEAETQEQTVQKAAVSAEEKAAEEVKAAEETAVTAKEVKVAEEFKEVSEKKTDGEPSEKIVLDDREIPDPEPTKEEKLTHTIPLDKVGMNTIPISLEEAIMSETPEERRIRILNNAMPTRMSDLQRQIFTYFARIPGMDTQILKAMSSVYEYAGEHTSKHGNVAIMGAPGTGKSRLSEGLITAMCSDMGIDVAKIARIRGDRMNELDPAKVVARMSGGFLIIENAGDMTSRTIENLGKAMEFRTDCMILIIEDEKTAMRALLNKYPDFAQKFSSTISIPVFTNDELVAFARTYCAENKCQMDELGVLALYSIISNGQSEDHPMTISEVKEILDVAMSKAKRGGRRGRRSSNKDKVITLYEKDFA